jgi:hypothetical protein
MRGEQALNDMAIKTQPMQAARRTLGERDPAIEQQPMAAALPDEFRRVGQSESNPPAHFMFR